MYYLDIFLNFENNLSTIKDILQAQRPKQKYKGIKQNKVLIGKTNFFRIRQARRHC